MENLPHLSAADEVPSSPAVATPTNFSSEQAEQAVKAPFQWSQVESSDYRTYIANLRRIGCPEQTIRELIMADVDDDYSARRERLRRDLGGDDSFASRSSLETGLQKLRNEEAEVVRALLGANPDRVLTSEDSASPNSGSVASAAAAFLARHRLQQEADKAPALPVAFQKLDLDAVTLDADQLRVIEASRQSFLQDIGGTNQDPNDPAYLKRWLSAQRDNDERLSAELGRRVYQQLKATE
jgi:hypothetical protein